jgi:transposase
MKIPFKKVPEGYYSRALFPGNIFDTLPKDHECFLYKDIFQQIDTSDIEKKYSRRGQNAYHPKLIVSILIYAYSRGVFSSRQIERRCREDLSFMFISEMNCPNFRVLGDFRKNNPDFFHACFKQSVLLAMELGLASLGHVSLDGSKFKANTSKHKAMSYKRLKDREKELTEEIESLVEIARKCDKEEDEEYKEKTGYEIPEDLKHREGRLSKIRKAKAALEKREEEQNPGKEISDKKQISFADTEARIMGKNGSFQYAFNGQIVVDEDNQIIVAQHVSQEANDKKEIKPALENLLETTGSLPSQLSADNGYMSGDNLEAVKKASINAFIATHKGDRKNKLSLDSSGRKLQKSDFVYREEDDSFICPAGQTLVLKSKAQDGKRVYQSDSAACAECLYRNRCCRSTRNSGGTISTDCHEAVRQEMNDKMESKVAKEIYGKRKGIVEPVFGQTKNNGFTGFSMRGHEKSGGEFSLVCAAHNFKKIMRAIAKGAVSLGLSEPGNLTTMPA